MFSIAFLNPCEVPPPEAEFAYGRIVANGLSERFLSALNYWGREAYLTQWAEAVSAVISGSSREVLITSICPPNDPDCGFCWALYREGDIVYLQNNLLFPEQLASIKRVRVPAQRIVIRLIFIAIVI